jgi:glycerol transport system ATP-binding protein
VQDVGTYWLVTASCGGSPLRARLAPGDTRPRVGDRVWLKVTGAHTCYYGAAEELIASADLTGAPA